MTTSAIPIQSVMTYVQAHEGVWWPDGAEYQKRIYNPNNDPIIERVQLFRFNILQQYLRDSEFLHVWRDTGSGIAAVLAEHRAESLRILYREVFAREMVSELENAGPVLAELLDSMTADHLSAITQLSRTGDDYDSQITKMQAKGHNPLVLDDVIQGMTHSGISTAMLDRTLPTAINYESSWIAPTQVDRPLRLYRNVAESQRPYIREWAKHLGPLQHDLRLSFDIMVQQNFLSSLINNQLQGSNAKNNRSLLVDGGIPLPTLATFLGWWQIAGVAFRHLTPRERAIYMLDQNSDKFEKAPHFILTYIPPLMIKTQEHVLHSQIMTEDSHADHSLGVRSPGHRRDSYGHIVYGIQRVKTVLLGDEEHTVCDDLNPASFMPHTGATVHQSHLNMLPRFENTQDTYFSYYKLQNRYPDVFTPHTDLPFLFDLRTQIENPFSSGGDLIGFNKIIVPTDIDVGYRSLAKFGRIHYRFDSRDASDAWCERFEEVALQFATATPWEMTAAYMEAVIPLQNKNMPPSSEQRVTKAGKMIFTWGD